MVSKIGLGQLLIVLIQLCSASETNFKAGDVVQFRNYKTNDYLYPGSNEFAFDSTRRNVFGQRNLPTQNLRSWVLEADEDYPDHFRIKSQKLDEYLFAAGDEFKHDPKRRRIFTIKMTDANKKDKALYWQITNQWRGARVKNLAYEDFLYRAADDFSTDASRRVIFSWNTEEDLGDEGVWIINNECHKDVKGTSGLIASEGFPSSYPSNSDCTWDISVNEGQRVQLTFHILNVQHRDKCSADWVKVQDSNGTLLKQMCGSINQNIVVESSSNIMHLQLFSNGYSTSQGFLASWEAISGQDDNQNIPSDKSFTFSMPQSFTHSQEGVAEKVCLELNNVNSDGEVLIGLLAPNDISLGGPSTEIRVQHKSGDSGINCHNLTLPQDFNDTSAIVRIKADFPTLKYKILSFKAVQVVQGKPMVLIQTDKYDYRPKQDVKFRVLILNPQLTPNENEVIKKVWVEEPNESRVAQWKDVAVKKGLVQLSMPLSEEPILGTWKIKTELTNNEITETTFTVSESVLPKFEVTFEGPSIILKNSPEETFTACAKYTHGSHVKGLANIIFSTTFNDYSVWPNQLQVTNVSREMVRLEQGCTTVKLSNEEIGLLYNKSQDVSAEISVKEESTGEEHSTTWKGQISNLPFKLEFGGSSTKHILGGFPYVGTLRAVSHNGSPIANTQVKLCGRLFTKLEDSRGLITSKNFYSADEDELLELSEKLSTLKVEEVCSDYKTKSDGTLHFTVPLHHSLPSKVDKLSFKATGDAGFPNDDLGMINPVQKLDVIMSRTNISHSLTIHDVEDSNLKCSENTVQVFYSAKPADVIDVNYVLTSGASILENVEQTLVVGEKDIKDEYVGDAELITFKIDEVSGDASKTVMSKYIININRPLIDETRVSGKIKLLVSMRNSEGQVLSLIKEYKVLPCNSTTTASWSAKQVTPASPVSLQLKGLPGSFCGYSVVDKSVDLVPNPNKITVPQLTELKERIAEKRLAPSVNSNPQCDNLGALIPSFESIGIYLLSDSIVLTSVCEHLVDVTSLGGNVDVEQNNVYLYGFGVRSGGIQESFASTPANFQSDDRQSDAIEYKEVEKPTVDLRNFFPETWLFDLVDLNTEGTASLDLYTPHTITTWIADAVCSDLQTGLSVSNKAELLVSQDFFADILLPYAVKRGEVLPMNVSIFNSVDQKLPMKIVVHDSPQYTLKESEKSFCLDAKDSHIETFYVTAKDLNEVNITVEASIDSASVPNCGAPGAADGYKDTIQKPIIVKAEGFPIEKLQNEFLCRGGEATPKEETITMENLKLPNDLVEGSERAWVSITGDILAPSLSNLDSLVTLPTGCGEQNMLKLVPNIFLVEYLRGTNKSDTKLEDQAIRNMKIGYDRQNEHYRHSDGSYSIWGPSKDNKNNGSLWLTMFVVKAFSQASKFIKINEYLIRQSVEWLLEKQNNNTGCFESFGQTIHSSLAGPEQSLTASVLVALLEVRASNLDVKVKQKYINQALNCIIENPSKVTDTYTESLVTYALTLHNELKKASVTSNEVNTDEEKLEEPEIDTLKISKDHLEALLGKSNSSQNGKLFWTTKDGSLAKAVEITAYNTLSLIMHGDLAKAFQAIKWMTSNRNANGGFVSTQDTMVAMQALSKYSVKVTGEPNDLSVKFALGSEEHKFNLNQENGILLQKSKLESLSAGGENPVSFNINGKGCLMVQTILRYNVKESPEKSSFKLTAEHTNEELKLCAQYTGDKKSTDMVLIEAELLSGFAPVETSLEALYNEVSDPIVKRYEIKTKDNKVVLYFNNMAKEINCWIIELKQTMKIEELKPAIVKIYDYYNQEDVFSTQYNLSPAK